MRIDYQTRRVDIAASAVELPPLEGELATSFASPLVFMSEEYLIPVVDIAVKGETIRVSIDTGSSLGVQFYESAVAKLGLEEARAKAKASSLLGARGKAEIRTGTTIAVTLGPFQIDDAPASFSSRAHDPTQRMGNLGNAFLENFILTLDYAEGRILFQQRTPENRR